MGAPSKTSAFLAAIILMTTSMQNSATQLSSDPCKRRIGACNLYSLMFISRGFPNNIDIDMICNQLDSSIQCYGGCLSNNMDEAIGLQVMNYLCEPSRRNEINAASQLSCLQDPGYVAQRLNDDFETCVVSSMTPAQQELFDYERLVGAYDPDTTGQLCPHVNSVISCFLVKTEEFCGPEMVPVMANIFEITGDFFTNILITGCNRHTGIVSGTAGSNSHGNSHHVVKRTVKNVVDWMKK